MKKIKDPMRDHYISISDDILSIIDAPEIQRLRRIKQLGFSSLVYPGATHTRFSHTLGVLWTTKQFLNTIDINDQDTERQLKIAAVLHDTGHGPYSHAVESVRGTVNHEKKSCSVVDTLAERGLINDDDIDPIKSFICGTNRPKILSGDIDSDRMDYLSRDAHHTGISHGSIDSQTIIESSKLINGSLVFDKMAIQAIEGLLVSRKNMHGSVYSHPTVRSAEKMLAECIEREDSITEQEIYEYCDHTLHTDLTRSEDPVVTNLYSRITNRNIYKTAFCLREMHDIDVNSIDVPTLKSEIASKVELNDHELFIDTYSHTPSSLSITVDIDGQLVNFEDISGVDSLISNDGYSVRMSVYCPSQYKEDVNTICQKKFEPNIPNK